MPSERVVFGVPGCGKTTFGTRLARSWIEAGTPSDEVAYLGFTKAAAMAAAKMILGSEDDSALTGQFPYFRTIHALAYMGLRRKRPDVKLIKTADMKQFARIAGMDGAYAVFEWEELADVFRSMDKGGKTEWDQALSAYHVTRLQAQSVADLERARVEPSNQAFMMLGMQNAENKVYESFVKHYERFKASEGLIDFTDMLEFAMTEMDPINVRYAIVDEAQDLAPIHHALLDRVLSKAEEVFYIGDDDQCQPAGTEVATTVTHESKDISKVSVGDGVVTYDRHAAKLIHSKGVLKTSVRPYTGELITVGAGGRKTRCTDNHRFLCRWKKSARKSRVCITYLMERAGRYRVGWCQLFNSDFALHFNIRMNCEKAERGWILKVHEDRTDASVHESIIAARYGLPTAPFQPVNGATHMTREAIDATFDGIGDRSVQADKCLRDHGRRVEHPFILKVEDTGKKRTTLFETQACNMVDDLMCVPVMLDGEKVAWEPVSCSREWVVGEPVYSIKVDKHEMYVADGIVTHNSIFEWSGASSDLFLNRAEKARYKIELRQTRRYGAEIADLSARIIGRVSRRHPKDVLPVAGKASRISFSGEFKPISGDVLVLHRLTSGCAAIAKAYMEAGVPFRNERGWDPLGAHAQVMAWVALDRLSSGQRVSMVAAGRLIDELMPSTVVGDHGEKVRLVIHGAKSKLENLPNDSINLWDLVRANLLTSEGAHVIQERAYRTLRHTDNLEYYERTKKNGYDLEGDGPIARVTTIHGSKGREAQEVVVFNEMARKCWENPDAEHRLAYVAATRTKSDLTICLDSKVEWAKEIYDYPVEG